MSFDAVIANPGRLQILTALAVQERQDFVQLRQVTRLTDGNLSAHAKRLHSAGMLQIDKEFRAGKPVTSFMLTPAGRKALESHVRRLLSAISQRRTEPPAREATADTEPEAALTIAEPSPVFADEWVD